MRIQTRQFATIVILLAAILLSPLTLSAQAVSNDWSRLNAVAAGSKLSVKLRNGKNIEGTLSNVSDTALTLMVQKTSTEIKRDDIASVHQVTGKSATKSTLIGLGVGAGAGAAIGLAADAGSDSDGFEKIDNVAAGAITVVGAVAGAVTGYFIGRGNKKKVLIYEAK